ncbi:hypothetical protein J4207_06005 [Candidatus Woesearchaeota archaeon]|nr:hypothetical protein [Candidatus Woesearchaeota archaeon]
MIPQPRNTAIQLKPSIDAYGLRVPLVFGNEAPKGICPFAQAELCTHCDIGLGEGEFTPDMNNERLRFLAEEYFKDVLPNAAHVLVFNSGSTLNDKEMSQETRRGVVDYLSSLDCKVISFDSREPYVTKEKIEEFVRGFRQDQIVRVNLGLETQNDVLRLKNLAKPMSRHGIERAYGEVAKYNERIGIDVNILFQPPGVIGNGAIDEAVASAAYVLDLNEKHNVEGDINFHPFYPSQRILERFPSHPRARIEDAIIAVKRIKELVDARGSTSKLYVGWDDEGHDQQPETKRAEVARYKEKLDRFNTTQDVNYLTFVG